MEENNIVKERKQPILTAAGILTVVAGLVLAYFGFFMLMDANNAISYDLTEAEKKVLKYISIGGIYLLVNGVYHVIAGFYGAVNSGVADNVAKCKHYGYGLFILSVLNVVILSLLTDVAGNQFNMILVCVPILISVIYCVGSFLNAKMIRERQAEQE